MRVRAFGAIVGARHASPVKCAYGVLSVNISFASYHEIIALNAKNIHVMRRRARRVSLVPDILGCSGNIVNETVRAFGAIVGARHASPANALT